MDWMSYRNTDELPRLEPAALYNHCEVKLPDPPPLRVPPASDLSWRTASPLPMLPPTALPSCALQDRQVHARAARAYAPGYAYPYQTGYPMCVACVPPLVPLLVADVTTAFGFQPDVGRMITNTFKNSAFVPATAALSGRCRCEVDQRAQLAACTQRVCQQLRLPHDPAHIAAVVGTTVVDMQQQAQRTGIGSSSSDASLGKTPSLRVTETRRFAREFLEEVMRKTAISVNFRQLDMNVEEHVQQFGNADIGSYKLENKEREEALIIVKDFLDKLFPEAAKHLPRRANSRSHASAPASASRATGRSSCASSASMPEQRPSKRPRK